MLKKLRYELYILIISRKTENEYYALDNFSRENTISMKMVIRMADILMKTLRDLGWHCSISFGDTGLFVWSGKKPTSLWDVEIEDIDL
jgi:hypothetical protein